jgi:hypothetical protein
MLRFVARFLFNLLLLPIAFDDSFVVRTYFRDAVQIVVSFATLAVPRRLLRSLFCFLHSLFPVSYTVSALFRVLSVLYSLVHLRSVCQCIHVPFSDAFMSCLAVESFLVCQCIYAPFADAVIIPSPIHL